MTKKAWNNPEIIDLGIENTFDNAENFEGSDGVWIAGELKIGNARFPVDVIGGGSQARPPIDVRPT